MAGFQPARDDVRAEGMAEWMERRRREVAARGPEAEFAGRAAWAAGGTAGERPYAPRPGDVVTLPTQAEVMAVKLRIDRLVEAYVRRPGVPRSRTPVDEGGPL